MINMRNPWENITFGSQRRIDSESPFNFFWITDTSGLYGFFIQIENLIPQLDNVLRLRGVSIINRNTSKNNGEFILILNNNEDWELFLKICTDLIKISEKCRHEDKMINTIYTRLKKWQSFLKQNSNVSLTLPEQMGLYTELSCLAEYIIPNYNNERSIGSWTGPDFDKQDFSLDNKLIEVKSYISSKGAIVTISSFYQLDNSKKPLYLLIYGLTVSTNGISLIDLIENLEKLLQDIPLALEQFQEKLALCGYIAGITEPPFYKFIIDKRIAFNVDDSFPKITSYSVPQEISSVIYTLDISKCMEYKVEVNTVFQN